MIVDVQRLAMLGLLGCLGFVGWTMLHDDQGLEGRAAELACRGRVCNAVIQKKTRDLFGWTFVFNAYGDDTLLVSVTCTRALWVFGEYACDVSGADRAADWRFKQQ